MRPVAVHLRGPVPYEQALALQEQLVEQRAADRIGDLVLLLEHLPVITVGRGRHAEANVLDAGDVPVVRVSRGGDVTWHGPGQLVAWPIVAMPEGRRDLHRHLRDLEEAVIRLLAGLDLAATRDPRNSGVWLPAPEGPPRKVCAVGIAVRRWVTWHGLALNVDVDLAAYERIRPCGFDPDTVTSLSEHLDPAPSVPALASLLAPLLCDALGLVGPLQAHAEPTLASVLGLVSGSGRVSPGGPPDGDRSPR